MRVIPFALTTAALLIVGAGSAAAAGSSLAEGDTLYAINCDRTVYNDWQLMSVDASTALSTAIGDGSGSIAETPRACAGQPAYDPTTGTSCYIQWRTTDETSSSLAIIDVATGASTTIGQFFVAGDPNVFPSINSIAIGLDGTAYAFANFQLYKLNLATAELAPFRASLQETDAFAVDPSTGKLYTIDISGAVFEINGVTGADTYVDTWRSTTRMSRFARCRSTGREHLGRDRHLGAERHRALPRCGASRSRPSKHRCSPAISMTTPYPQPGRCCSCRTLRRAWTRPLAAGDGIAAGGVVPWAAAVLLIAGIAVSVALRRSAARGRPRAGSSAARRGGAVDAGGPFPIRAAR